MNFGVVYGDYLVKIDFTNDYKIWDYSIKISTTSGSIVSKNIKINQEMT
jgi:hypothetical protein